MIKANRCCIILFFSLLTGMVSAQIADNTYLHDLKEELKTKWPHNRTINLIFHGHSVPSGYSTKGVVDRLGAYPFLTLNDINNNYPYAVVNSITTSIGGEHAEQGAQRIDEVLSHNPDVVFIDYALNDRSLGLEKAKEAWESMIIELLDQNVKVILLTPTPDLREDITSSESKLALHSELIRALAKKYRTGLVDSYQYFQQLNDKLNLEGFMAQNNHINSKGHRFVANLIFKNYFSWEN